MKLRNKKTGEIGNLVLNINPNRESYSVLSTENGDTVCGNLVLADYESLAELNEEWEDYEDDDLSKIIEWLDKGLEDEILPISVNDFIEKLKAWKRLKDKGFRFALLEYTLNGDIDGDGSVRFGFLHYEKCNKDIELLFGDEK